MNEEAYEKTYTCPKCKTECGPDTINSCVTLQCPNCHRIFEPEWRED